MKLDITEGGEIRLREVFNGVLFETKEGEKLGVCMRDGAFEVMLKDINVKSDGNEEYYRLFRMGGGVVREMISQGLVRKNPSGGK